MPGYAEGSVAGVSLAFGGDNCKAVIVDGARTKTQRFVNQRFAADGTVYTQGFDTGGRGARFGVRFDFIPNDTLTDIITAINAALDATEPFNVTLDDGFHEIDTDVTVDGSEWLTYEGQRINEQVIGGVLMRFITT